MLISSVRIRNFRSLLDVTIPLSSGTVIIGENNTGKSAVLDALRFALTRSSARRAQPTEYDFHCADPLSDPKKGDGIIVDVTWAEGSPDEWPAAVIQELQPVIQTDVERDLRSIYLRFTHRYNIATKSFSSRWEFTNAARQELKGKNLNTATLLGSLLKLFPPFHLSALRSVADEFGTRSQFWTRLLRSLEISEADRAEIQARLDEVNNKVLSADPRLKEVTKTLEKLQHVVATATSDAVSVRALPHRIWDLLEKAEIVLKAKGATTSFPLLRHGQGVQSLAILFLFRAFVEYLTEDDKDSSPLLTLEEPEAHLHPQASRALWQQVTELRGQKVVTSHSPYFAQHVPFRNVVVLRRSGPHTRAFFLRSKFEVEIESGPALEAFIASAGGKYTYSSETRKLAVSKPVTDSEFKKLLMCFTDPATRGAQHAKLRELMAESRTYLDEEELGKLELYARRMRGEIMFARVWLLCEGPSDYAVLHAFATAIGKPLDSNGVAVIDYQNSGSPGSFVALARALGFPWFMLCDNDSGGTGHIEQIRAKGVPDDEIAARTVKLPEGDLEAHLVARIGTEVAGVASELGASLPPKEMPEHAKMLAEFLRGRKTEYASLLARNAAGWAGSKVPDPIAGLIHRSVEAASA